MFFDKKNDISRTLCINWRLPIVQKFIISWIGSLGTRFKLNLEVSISNFLTELKKLSNDSGHAEKPFADH